MLWPTCVLSGEVYLDHAGAALYSERQLREVNADLLSGVYGNPHSRGSASQRTLRCVREMRQRVLRHFNASPDEYCVVWTASATAALKLVGENFPWVGRSPDEARSSPLSGSRFR